MIKFKQILLFLLVAMNTAFSCKKEEKYFPPSDPAKAILGKWETIQMGNWPSMEPIEKSVGYSEYLTDSILREYNYETGTYFYKKYWIDSLLHESIKREDGYQLIFEYHYKFYDDKMRLDFAHMLAIYNTFILKRIN